MIFDLPAHNRYSKMQVPEHPQCMNKGNELMKAKDVKGVLVLMFHAQCVMYDVVRVGHLYPENDAFLDTLPLGLITYKTLPILAF